MNSCNTVQVMDPQVLGVRGDPAYDEYGNTALGLEKANIVVPFLYEKADASYRFEYLYVDGTATAPEDIRAVVSAQTTTGFTVRLSGVPTIAGATLRWHVMRPDPLQVNQPLTAGPTYAILRPSQQGLTPIVQGQSFVAVVFPVAQPDDDWVLEAAYIENLVDAVIPVFFWTMSDHAITGFRLELSATPETGNSKLRWKVA